MLALSLIQARSHKNALKSANWSLAPTTVADLQAATVHLSEGSSGLARYWKAGGPSRKEALISAARLFASAVLPRDADSVTKDGALWLLHAGAEAEVDRAISLAEAEQLQPEQA